MKQKSEYSEEAILIVDDEKIIRESLSNLLSSLGFKTGSSKNGKYALKKIKEENYTFLLTDINMPIINGIELIKTVKKKNPELNIIAMTGFNMDFSYMDVIKAGANDFIIKPFKIDEIEAKIKRIMIERDIKNELSRLSITDSLTGLFNQRHFNYRIREEVKRAKRQRKELSLILLDLDNFKEFNDSHGHLAGDDLLAEVGKIILSNIREDVDIAFRYGGDEFAVILVEADQNIALNIKSRLSKGFEKNGKISASIGFVTYSKGDQVKDLIALADRNLYRVKKAK